jgi:hypothetical protein
MTKGGDEKAVTDAPTTAAMDTTAAATTTTTSGLAAEVAAAASLVWWLRQRCHQCKGAEVSSDDLGQPVVGRLREA